MKNYKWRIIENFSKNNREFSIENFRKFQISPEKTFIFNFQTFLKNFQTFSPSKIGYAADSPTKNCVKFTYFQQLSCLCVYRRWSHAMTLRESKQKKKKTIDTGRTREKKKIAEFFLKIKRQILRKGNNKTVKFH